MVFSTGTTLTSASFRHTRPDSLRRHVHNGGRKLGITDTLDSYDILLVSYQTLAREWATSKERSILFTTKWLRVILDEGVLAP